MKTELLIAWRYLKSKRKEKIISAIAMFSLIGIALGVATLIIVTSVMNGFRKEFTERIIGFNGHLSMHPIALTDYQKIAYDVKNMDDVTLAIPMTERQAIISNQDTVRGSLVCGIAHQDLMNKKLISENIVAGNLKNFSSDDSIVLGDSLAKRARINIGDEVIVLVPKMDETGFGAIPRKKTFNLVATFSSGMHNRHKIIKHISSCFWI